MKRIVKLTESELTQLIRRVINESKQTMSIEQIDSKLTSCYNVSEYPALTQLAKTMGLTVASLIFAILSFFAPEFFVPAFAITALMTDAEYKKLQEIVKKNQKLKNELKKLSKCLRIII
jgi:hypothetical protein